VARCCVNIGGRKRCWICGRACRQGPIKQVWEQDTLVQCVFLYKPLGAVCAVAAFVEAGRIGLDSPFADAWPGIRPRPAKEQITLAFQGAQPSLRGLFRHQRNPGRLKPVSHWDAMASRARRASTLVDGPAKLTATHLSPLRLAAGRNRSRPQWANAQAPSIQEAICQPLGMDFFVGVPTRTWQRIAHVSATQSSMAIWNTPAQALRSMGQPEVWLSKPSATPPGMMVQHQTARMGQQAEILSANGTRKRTLACTLWQLLRHGENWTAPQLLG